MTLYHTENTPPTKLPFRVTLADGSTLTDVSNQLSDEELFNIGYIKSPIKPQPETNKVVHWVDGAWMQVDVQETPAAEISLSRVEFMDLFTAEEEGAIRLLARSTDPADVQESIQMEMFLSRVMVAESISLSDARVIYGITALRAMGILASDVRQNQVLNGIYPDP